MKTIDNMGRNYLNQDRLNEIVAWLKELMSESLERRKKTTGFHTAPISFPYD